MNEGLTTNEQKALEKLYKSVAHRIVQDEDRGNIVADLVKQGWSEESAVELVDNVEETIEEYEEPPKKWRQTKARRYMWGMFVGLLFLIAGIGFLVLGFVAPEYEYILPIGLLVTGALFFFGAFPKWLKYRK